MPAFEIFSTGILFLHQTVTQDLLITLSKRIARGSTSLVSPIETTFFNYFLAVSHRRFNRSYKRDFFVNGAPKLVARFSTFLSTGRTKGYPQVFHRTPV